MSRCCRASRPISSYVLGSIFSRCSPLFFFSVPQAILETVSKYSREFTFGKVRTAVLVKQMLRATLFSSNSSRYLLLPRTDFLLKPVADLRLYTIFIGCGLRSCLASRSEACFVFRYRPRFLLRRHLDLAVYDQEHSGLQPQKPYLTPSMPGI